MKIHCSMRATSVSLILCAFVLVLNGRAQTTQATPNSSPNQSSGDQIQNSQDLTDQTPQEQSLGDVARASHPKKAAGAALDNEAMAAARSKRSGGTDNEALNCDADCVAAVKQTVQQQPGLRMTEEQWRAALSAGEDLLAQDGEWNSLFAEIQQRVCHPKSAADKPNSSDDLDRRVARKLIDEVREGISELSHSMADAKNPAAQAQAVADARALAIKQLILKVQVDRAKSSCLSAASPKSAN